MHVFYLAQPLEGSLSLSEEESKHCVQVLRLGIGDELQVINGKGSIALAEITSAHPKRCEISILSASHKKQADFSLHLACAPTKNIDRYEWMLEKSTEIGIEKINFIAADTLFINKNVYIYLRLYLLFSLYLSLKFTKLCV